MADVIELNAQLREHTGKAVARRMRREEGLVPAVVYGAGKESMSLVLDHNEIFHGLKNEAIYSSILDLKIGDKKQKVVLKAIQRHAYKPRITHVDFLRVRADEAIQMNVPLHFINEEEAPGVKEGGVVSKLMTELEIKCLPADLPEAIEVDMSSVEMGGSLHMTNIKLPQGVTLAVELDEEHDHPILSIHMPKEEVEEEVEAAEGEEGAAEEGAEGAPEGGEAAEGGEDAKAEDQPESGDKE